MGKTSSIPPSKAAPTLRGLTGGLSARSIPVMAEIAKVRYTHDAVIDEILSDPSISQGELAARFGYTQAWMSIIINSDAFKEKLAERRGVLIDPRVAASISDRLDAVARRSLEKLLDRLDSPNALKPHELVAMAKLGVGDGASIRAGTITQNNYVVNLPPPAANPEVWLKNARGNVTNVSHSNPEP